MDATYLFLLFVYFVPPPARDDVAPCQLQRFRKLLWKKADGRKRREQKDSPGLGGDSSSIVSTRC